MDLNKILKMNPKSECKITYDGYYRWSSVYYQLKESNDIDVNTLPLLDEKYMNEAGDALYNNNQEEVYNPNQEIKHENTFFQIPWRYVYTSKSLIGLLQKKINEFIDEETPDINDEYVFGEFLEWLGTSLGTRGAIDDIAYFLKCKDLNQILQQDGEDEYLWYTAAQMEEEGGEIIIEEL